MNAAQLEFEADLHRYSVAGIEWPSVSSILAPLQLLDGIPQHILDAAADFGRNVHSAVHLHNLGRLDEQDLDQPLRPYLDGWKRFLFDTKAVVLESERRVCHPTLQIAGTLDSVVKFPQKDPTHVLDVKTGAAVHWTVALQTAAYREMLSLEGVRWSGGIGALQPISKVRLCCHLLGDGKYKLLTLKDQTRDWNDFVSAANFMRLRQRHGRPT